MFIPCSVLPGAVTFVKILKGAKESIIPKTATSQDPSFNIEGFSEEG